MTKSVLLYSTHPTAAQARQTARALLKKKLVACCNLLPEMESHYHWEGKLTCSAEVAMISKTTSARSKAAIKTIRALHPYDIPAIIAVPITEGSKPFLRWITKETAAS